MTVPGEEATANYVPAAAVIRRVRALFGFTGRKACAGGFALKWKRTENHQTWNLDRNYFGLKDSTLPVAL